MSIWPREISLTSNLTVGLRGPGNNDNKRVVSIFWSPKLEHRDLMSFCVITMALPFLAGFKPLLEVQVTDRAWPLLSFHLNPNLNWWNYVLFRKEQHKCWYKYNLFLFFFITRNVRVGRVRASQRWLKYTPTGTTFLFSVKLRTLVHIISRTPTQSP